MGFCLPIEKSKAFIKALGDGTIDPGKLAEMTSDARRSFFENLVGKEDAMEVNALFESKLLLKDYKTGLVSWAKKVGGISEARRSDLISRIEKMDRILNPADEQAFLADLAAQRIGASVTVAEAKKISDFTKTTKELEEKIPADAPLRSPDRMNYGYALDDYHTYLNHLMGKDKGASFKEALQHPFRTVAGATKGILSAFDNSFFGRQGFKMLWTNPDIWGTTFLKSWADMGRELAGKDPMRTNRADVLSRPAALSGEYRAGGYDLGINFEEAFPSALPERIPVLGRLYKASESAFNGAALRMRADYADRVIKLAKKNGLNTLDPRQARGLGQMVNSMTGRGGIGKLNALGSEINTAIFSIKFLKSNIDALTMHRLGFGIEGDAATRSFVRKQAALNLVRIVGGIAAIMTVANAISPGSAETNPRSPNFGKIKVGKTTIDVSGGMGSLVTLASRITPTMHDGKWSFWTRNAAGKYSDLHSGKFGASDALDVINNFWEGKLSPIAGAFRDVWKGQNYDGKKVTPENVIGSLVTPLPAQTFISLMNEPDSAVRVAAMILDGLGFSANAPMPKK